MKCQREKQGLGESRGWRDGGKPLSLASEVGKGEITEYRNGDGEGRAGGGFLSLGFCSQRTPQYPSRVSSGTGTELIGHSTAVHGREYGLPALLLGAQEPQESGRESLSSPDSRLCQEVPPVWTLA